MSSTKPIPTIESAQLSALEELAENALGADVARALVPSEQLLALTTEIRFLRALGLTRREAAAALYACQYAHEALDGAAEIAALDGAIGKLRVIEIAGDP